MNKKLFNKIKKMIKKNKNCKKHNFIRYKKITNKIRKGFSKIKNVILLCIYINTYTINLFLNTYLHK